MAVYQDLFAEIEKVRSDGALVLLKWDNERAANRCTVVITRADSDYVWRKDTDDIDNTIIEAMSEYWAAHRNRAV